MTPRWIALALLAATAAFPVVARDAAAVCNDPGQFGPPIPYTTGPNPLYTAVGDFNHDGKPDLAVTNSEFPTVPPVGTVAILLNNGGLSFSLAGTYPVGSVPHGIVTGDFNGDGILDLAVANKFSNSISVLIGQGSGGNGNGTFAPEVRYPTTYRPFQLVVADFNSDGILDLATSMNSAARMGVLLGQGSGGVGNGTFGLPTMYILNAASTGITTADFNGDGILDLAATENSAGTIEVRLGNGTGGVGTGSFGPASHFAAGVEPFGFAVADFNGDTVPDLAVANTTSGGTAILLGIGNGAFQAPTFVPSGNCASVASLDANGDGIQDLATGSATGSDTGDLRLWLGNGSGGVGNGTFGSGTTYASGVDEYQVKAADLDLDGKPDLISSVYLHDYIQVFSGACVAAPPDLRKPVLTDVRDVPHDQGGKVFLTWNASSLDVSGGPVQNYRVWRRVPDAFAARIVTGDDAAPAWRTTSVTRADGTTSVEYWEPIVTLPAQRRAGYGYTASTLSDSAEAWVPYEAYFVSALTSNIDVFYDSNVDSGYSVDNIPPAAPAGITGTAAPTGVALQWQPNQEPDLVGYRVYRGTDPGFATDGACMLASPADPAYTDATDGFYFYKVTAVDKHGNESPYAEATSPATTGAAPGVEFVFSLRGATPNPTSGDNLRIAFSLPSTAAASVTVTDVAGRTVATRELASPTPGAQTLLLSGTQRLPAGMYLVHLKQGARSAVRKVVVSH